MKHRAFTSALILLISIFPLSDSSHAAGPVFFPKGPYASEILSVDVLKSESANFAALTLPDGTIRGYAPSIVEKTFVVFESKDDGRTFNRVGVVDFGDSNSDAFIGQPRVIKLNDGKYHLYSSGPDGISCFSSTDGFKFSIDQLRCVPKSIIPTPPYYKGWRLSGAAVAILADGNYRMYFSDAGEQNDNRFPPHQIFSVKSSDGVNWILEPGARIGYTTKTIKGNAIHPEVIQHSDGSVTLFYRSYIPQNINYAFSSDGLNFTEEYISWFGKKDPIVGYGNEGGDPSLVLDKNGNIVMFQGTWTGPDKLGTSAIRLTVGKGTKYGEEVGRDLGWRGFLQNREMNCISKSSPSDADYGRVWVLSSSETDVQCPDNYTIDSANPVRTVLGPKYSSTTKCFWIGSGNPPFGLREVYFSGSVACPDGFSTSANSSSPSSSVATEIICYAGNNLVNAIPIIKLTDGSTKCPPDYSTTPPATNSNSSSKPETSISKSVTCYAKKGMIVRSPTFTLNDGSSSCPSGYSKAVNKAKPIKVTCKAAPNSKVAEKQFTLYGIGKKPSCPKGYVVK